MAPPLSPGGERGGIIGFPSWGNSGSPLYPGGERGGIIGFPSWGNSSGTPLSPGGERVGIIGLGNSSGSLPISWRRAGWNNRLPGIVVAPLSPGGGRGGMVGGIGVPPISWRRVGRIPMAYTHSTLLLHSSIAEGCDLYKSTATPSYLEDVVANIHSPSIMHCARSH